MIVPNPCETYQAVHTAEPTLFENRVRPEHIDSLFWISEALKNGDDDLLVRRPPGFIAESDYDQYVVATEVGMGIGLSLSNAMARAKWKVLLKIEARLGEIMGQPLILLVTCKQTAAWISQRQKCLEYEITAAGYRMGHIAVLPNVPTRTLFGMNKERPWVAYYTSKKSKKIKRFQETSMFRDWVGAANDLLYKQFTPDRVELTMKIVHKREEDIWLIT